MNHIKSRRKDRRRILLERIVMTIILIVGIAIIALAWGCTALGFASEGMGIFFILGGAALVWFSIKYWNILNQEEGVNP